MSFLPDIAFSEFWKRCAAWNKAQPLCFQHPTLGRDPNVIRIDSQFNYILFSEYGNRNSEYGWERDHIVPLSKGGLDTDDNIQALHWRANLSKSSYLSPGLFMSNPVTRSSLLGF